MSKQQIIEAIRQHNRTANQELLTTFDEHTLENYLKRLTLINGRRGRASVWVRQPDTTSIVTRRH